MAPGDRTSKAPTLSEHESSFVDVERPSSFEATQSTPQSLSRAVWERRAEYTRPASIRIKVGTWNAAACSGVEKDIGDWFVEGRGVDAKLSGLKIGGQDDVEVAEGEERRTARMASHGLAGEGKVIGGDEIGIYVLGLQEIVSLASAKEYIGRVYVDSGPLNVWKEAVGKAVPAGYECVAETQMSGLLLLIYAHPDVAPTISNVSSSSVGTGVMGYLGNKGAVSTRIVLGETTRLVFINAHLASGSDKPHLDRRIWDWNQIITRTKFAPVNKGGVVEDTQESIGDEDFAFVCGDLNFRLEGLPGSDIRRLLMLHTKGEYNLTPKAKEELGSEPIVIHHVDSDDDELSDFDDSARASSEATDLPDPEDSVQDPHNDPTSLQATLDSILPHDQLRKAQRQKKAFHDGWREGLITFLPTYKYDVGSFATFDSSEKLRAPSWCDRILYRTKEDAEAHAKQTIDLAAAKKRDEEMKASGLDEAARSEEVLFDYDPTNDGIDVPGKFDYDYDEYDESTEPVNDTASVVPKERTLDTLRLDLYTSHQHIVTSDHKPLTAIFTLHYPAVVPAFKAKVHQEVARELDRAENEQRPGITILVDTPARSGAGAWPEATTSDAAMGVNFGNVRYLQRKVRALTIANTGQVLAKFSFISRPVADGKDEQIKPDWLSFRFVDSYEANGKAKELQNEVTLHPGDTITANLEIYVQDVQQVRALNTGDLQLDDVLVLRVVDGRDYFVPVRGNWLQSCFGRSIPELIRIPDGGARKLEKSLTVGRDVQHSAPKELFKLTEAIEALIERAIADKEMVEELQTYTPDGWPFDATLPAAQRSANRWYCLEALENDTPLLTAFPAEVQAVEKLEIIAEVLLLFLGSMTDGVVPAHIWAKIETEMLRHKTAVRAADLKACVLDEMSAVPHHHISLVFLTAMLCKVVAERVPGVGGREEKMGHGLSRRKSIRKSIGKRVRLGVGGHRRTGSEAETAEALRGAEWRRVEIAVAEVVARVLGGSGMAGEGGKRGSEGRKREVLESFLVTG